MAHEFWLARVVMRCLVVMASHWAFSPSVQAAPSRNAAAAPSSSQTPPVPASPVQFDASENAGVDEGARARARSLYDQGARAYTESRYYQAAEYFLDAHRVYPMPQLLFNVAKAYDKLGVQGSALAYYRDYLRALPNAQDAAEVGSRVRELEAALLQRGIQQVSVFTEPNHALLAFDGIPVGITPWTGETWPGAHRVTVTLDGHKPLATLITVDALHAQDVNFELEPVVAPKAGRACSVNPASRQSPEVSTLTWIVLGTATAALATTLAVEMAEKNASGLTRTGAFFGGIGITTSVLGGVLLHLDLHEPGVTPTQKQRAYFASITSRF